MVEVFTDEWRAEMAPRWARRSPADPSPHQLMVADEARAPFRRWMNEQVGLVAEDKVAGLVSRLRSEKNFVQTVHELGAGALLRASGYDAIDYERALPLGSPTPLKVLTPTGCTSIPHPVKAASLSRL